MAKAKSVRFVSKMQSLTLCIRPNRQTVQDGVLIPVPGDRVYFENGECTLTDPKKIAFVRNHDLFGTQITEANIEQGGEDQDEEETAE